MGQRGLPEQVIRKALRDAGFKKRLMADPRAALKDEFGIMLPADLQLSVVENTRNMQTFVLPALSDELSDGELDQVAGGFHEANFSGQWGLNVIGDRPQVGLPDRNKG